MTQKEYKRLTLAQMQKRRWRLARDVGNYAGTMRKGTEVIIDGKMNGLRVEGVVCAHCGLKLAVSHVDANAVEEIE
jgi:hypothetical protein